MKLAFIYQPVTDIAESVAFYRDSLGLEEAWREGDDTVAFKLPQSDVGIMLDKDDRETTTGPFFVVDDVVAFYEKNKATLRFIGEPRPIPPGMYAAFTDPSGNVIRIMDASAERH